MWPLQRRPVALPENSELWPMVDIFIPTYNERENIGLLLDALDPGEAFVVDGGALLHFDSSALAVVLERLQTGQPKPNTRLLFQLEFVGFSRLGTNATGVLKENIPRYQFLRDQVAPPSRFTQYD